MRAITKYLLGLNVVLALWQLVFFFSMYNGAVVYTTLESRIISAIAMLACVSLIISSLVSIQSQSKIADAIRIGSLIVILLPNMGLWYQAVEWLISEGRSVLSLYLVQRWIEIVAWVLWFIYNVFYQRVLVRFTPR